MLHIMGFRTNGNLLPVFLTLTSFCLEFGTSLDTISASQFIKDHETISSTNGALELGFFSPQNSTNRYVGIWYLSESNVIWVANRDQPLHDSFGMVTISNNKNLVVLNGKKQVVWSSNVSVSNTAFNSTAQLLNTGNLVLVDDIHGIALRIHHLEASLAALSTSMLQNCLSGIELNHTGAQVLGMVRCFLVLLWNHGLESRRKAGEQSLEQQASSLEL